ncbi:hypothetical protein SAMN05421866_1504 [Chryseobacterium oranimense]|uniref:Uncharacterized protein n=1 Tax=Chryseobacterium oranimense TaxID=421058 RepID=A0A1M5NMK4_9FLAO|nr:hypothetical protein BN1195_00793 [Chryseobacterium oranimense G311]SHG90738.1 hypothetical protein SAMN05421866_1504 [Chryseobacterium oranimense]
MCVFFYVVYKYIPELYINEKKFYFIACEPCQFKALVIKRLTNPVHTLYIPYFKLVNKLFPVFLTCKGLE